jgi:hypothetical protein
MNNITNTYITFLSEIDKNLEIDKSEKYKFLNLYSWRIEIITIFINNIRDNDIFLIFPFITTTKRTDDPYLRLSNQFLVTNKSNPKLISDFLEKQWNKSDFMLSNESQCWLYIKYKKVYIRQKGF